MNGLIVVALIDNYGEGVGDGEVVGVGAGSDAAISIGGALAIVAIGTRANDVLGTGSVAGPLPQLARIEVNLTPVRRGIGLTKNIV